MVKQKKKASQSFPKSERLNSKKLTKELFEKGSSFYTPPFKVIYCKVNAEISKNHQVLITVPKKNFKSAVSRNLLKRRIREAYRINKQLLLIKDYHLLIAYIYIGKEIAEYKSIENKLIETLMRLNSIE